MSMGSADSGLYKVPKERLYVTYFGRNKELNLDPDEEVPTSSRSLCLPPARVHF